MVPFDELLDEMIGLLAEDAAVLGCTREVEAARMIFDVGNSAERQRKVFEAARETMDQDEAMRAVIRSLIKEYHADL